MGIFKAAFRALPYAIGLMTVLFFSATVLGISWQFGSLFSWPSFFVFGFLIFAIAAMREQ